MQQTKYLFRKVSSSAPTIRRRDGDEIFFSRGKNGAMVDGPDPGFCNLKLAVARAVHACGAAEVIDDEGGFLAQPSYLVDPMFLTRLSVVSLMIDSLHMSSFLLL